MSTAKPPQASPPLAGGDRESFLAHVDNLIDCVEGWARRSDWSTRRIEKTMRDSQGDYSAPAVLFQKEFCRILLDPIGASSSTGDEAIVDLYRLPEYDDIARLYFQDGEWRIHFVVAGATPTAAITDATSPSLSQERFSAVLEAMARNAA